MARLAASEWRLELPSREGGAQEPVALLTLALEDAQAGGAGTQPAAQAPAQRRVTVQLDRAALAELAARLEAIQSAVGARTRVAAERPASLLLARTAAGHAQRSSAETQLSACVR
jgi:hypothetical protein